MHEYELEAEFLRVAMAAGLRHTGYPSIVAAGKNAATLHYDRNNGLVGDSDMVLVDAGAEFRYDPFDCSCLRARATVHLIANIGTKLCTHHALQLSANSHALQFTANKLCRFD